MAIAFNDMARAASARALKEKVFGGAMLLDDDLDLHFAQFSGGRIVCVRPNRSRILMRLTEKRIIGEVVKIDRRSCGIFIFSSRSRRRYKDV